MSLKEFVPWWGKIAAKVFLSRVPLGYRLWRRLNLFVHGAMDSPEYAFGVVTAHLKRLGLRDLRDKVVLELGPGDSLLSALIARALNARRVYLVDVAAFANSDINHFLDASKYLKGRGLEPPAIDGSATMRDVLATCSAEYMTQGLEDLRRIPAGSVDFVFSQAVLEHIRLRELSATLAELRRVMAPSGAASHVVDLQDHLGGALNNLRFSARVWESEFMARSGFYTNRVRYLEMLDLFRAAGCKPEVVGLRRWDSLPTALPRLAQQFRRLSIEDLLVSGFDVIARPT
jgi:SAM-dependent methyltransferase